MRVEESARVSALHDIHALLLLNEAYREAGATLAAMPQGHFLTESIRLTEAMRAQVQRDGDRPLPSLISLPYVCRVFVEPLDWLVRHAADVNTHRLSPVFGNFDDYQWQDFLSAAKLSKNGTGSIFYDLIGNVLKMAERKLLLSRFKP